VTDWQTVVSELRKAASNAPVPSVTLIADVGGDPFAVLVSTMISLRTKDEVTLGASRRLLKRAPTPSQLSAVPTEEVARLIYPAGFYNTKAKNLVGAATYISDECGGKVPSSLGELLKLSGVGRKTANLVLGLGFGTPAICVDTHVHRIANRNGWIDTATPEQTEFALAEVLPKQHWIEINTLLVAHGQQTCTPLSPWCSGCSIAFQCRRVDVSRSR